MNEWTNNNNWSVLVYNAYAFFYFHLLVHIFIWFVQCRCLWVFLYSEKICRFFFSWIVRFGNPLNDTHTTLTLHLNWHRTNRQTKNIFKKKTNKMLRWWYIWSHLNAIQLFYAPFFFCCSLSLEEFTLKIYNHFKVALISFYYKLLCSDLNMFLCGGGDLCDEEIILTPSSQCFSHLVYGSKSLMPFIGWRLTRQNRNRWWNCAYIKTDQTERETQQNRNQCMKESKLIHFIVIYIYFFFDKLRRKKKIGRRQIGANTHSDRHRFFLSFFRFLFFSFLCVHMPFK